MTLLTTGIPDDPAELPGWLERRLVAPDFGRFVAELAAAHPERPGDRVPVLLVLEEWYRTALADGLRAVPVRVLRELLRRPSALVELQEAVLTDGGPYWEALVEESADLTPGFERGRARLEAMFSAGSGPMLSPEAPREDEAPAEPLPLARREPRPPKNDRRLLALSTALAACLLIALGVQAYRQKSATSAGEAVAWGWAKPG
ncbi:MAG TPA: hypothetical protein VKE74_28905, partial [Gemmataceae bacterium]|nr:hypothetical protein [Gemmataceae bacterium]